MRKSIKNIEESTLSVQNSTQNYKSIDFLKFRSIIWEWNEQEIHIFW